MVDWKREPEADLLFGQVLQWECFKTKYSFQTGDSMLISLCRRSTHDSEMVHVSVIQQSLAPYPPKANIEPAQSGFDRNY